ncbi:hypothetical protein AVEN_164356-1 [Araneus ventricosus]|uniref:Uncharacterized protein n=1 Tax=Araneus ventricosus TaxID=182803 RepID=A0A4Y2TPB1_ARAVE|nr:hypothetical protein AVEN_164356-1 [Araneus ventricosus]
MGGGTALLMKNSINHHPTPVSTSKSENTSVSIDLPNNNSFTISSIYRPPHGRITSSTSLSKELQFGILMPSLQHGVKVDQTAMVQSFIITLLTTTLFCLRLWSPPIFHITIPLAAPWTSVL